MFIFLNNSKNGGKNIFYKDVLTSLPENKIESNITTMRSLQLQPYGSGLEEIFSGWEFQTSLPKVLNVGLVKQEETKQFLSFLRKEC
ncbi:BEM_HP_G0099680.mRNA.1.CDS.1 [Saccharomyces cerevisiae]|nr:BEM_HP_G0099680.mRNA.1.CDS.1 [Saccharomyces cerevisiae]CAI7007009.1 BEM_HP_G0099680.mRNA.1.CDS.1 [Saccharomyces cerevisiae]